MLLDNNQLQKELDKALESFKKELSSIRTGKANPADLEDLQIEVYGGMNPLNSVGQVIAEDAMTLKVNVWDKGVLPVVEKALREAGLGGSVAVDKDSIRLKFSPMTEEDRQKRVKELKDIAEDFRVRVRQIRQKFMKTLDSIKGESEDELERNKKALQDDIDKMIDKIDDLSEKKEQDLLKI